MIIPEPECLPEEAVSRSWASALPRCHPSRHWLACPY